MENFTRNSLNKAVKELELGLLRLSNPTYNNIDKLMRNIMKKYDLTAKELHYGFKDKHNKKTPDDWIKGERKMKTFREFIEEAHFILDEDAASYSRKQKNKKARGRQGKTPLYVDRTTGRIQRTPEGKWKVIKTTERTMSEPAQLGRFAAGRHGSGPVIQGGGHGGAEMGYTPRPHSTGGRLRGKKKREQPPIPETRLNKFQRRAKLNKERRYRTGEDLLHIGLIGDKAAKSLRDKAQKSFSAASKEWDKK